MIIQWPGKLQAEVNLAGGDDLRDFAGERLAVVELLHTAHL